VLAVGRLTYYKGFHFLIQAVDCVEDVHVDLVGDGEQANELKQLVASLGLQKRVVLHGTTDDHELALLLARCDCLCLPSIERTEAFGMVLLEAMSFGKATVVSSVPGSGMSWVVDDGVTGLQVPPADPAALAGAFRQLATDRSKLRAMGQAGRQKFERLFDINHASEGVVDTYNDVLPNRARAEGISGG